MCNKCCRLKRNDLVYLVYKKPLDKIFVLYKSSSKAPFNTKTTQHRRLKGPFAQFDNGRVKIVNTYGEFFLFDTIEVIKHNATIEDLKRNALILLL